MQANYVQRLRFIFTKTGPTRYISHLDVARALERALNRAKIPLAYTQGYNKRPRMQLAAALPLGFTSDCEIADIWLMEAMEPDVAQVQMMTKMAPGITILNVEEIPLSDPATQTLTAEARYEAVLLDPYDKADLQTRIDAFLAADSLERERRGKEYDLRPLVLGLTLYETEDGALRIDMHLYLLPGKTGRPDEVLDALGLDPLAARIHRTAIILADEPVPIP
ncbi:MAG: TIGR03936 family radical SAM-associated protein [Candidatus Promineifilaceae bacterium]